MWIWIKSKYSGSHFLFTLHRMMQHDKNCNDCNISTLIRKSMIINGTESKWKIIAAEYWLLFSAENSLLLRFISWIINQVGEMRDCTMSVHVIQQGATNITINIVIFLRIILMNSSMNKAPITSTWWMALRWKITFWWLFRFYFFFKRVLREAIRCGKYVKCRPFFQSVRSPVGVSFVGADSGVPAERDASSSAAAISAPFHLHLFPWQTDRQTNGQVGGRTDW